VDGHGTIILMTVSEKVIQAVTLKTGDLEAENRLEFCERISPA